MANQELIFRALLRHYQKNVVELDEILSCTIQNILSSNNGLLIEATHGGRSSRFALPSVLFGQSISVDQILALLERVKWTLTNATPENITAYLTLFPNNRSIARWNPTI